MSDTATAVDTALEADRLRAALASVNARIAAACARAGRHQDEVTVLAVSKSVAPDRLAAALEAGIDVLGENRVQEAEAKAALLHGARWQMIGRLQSNKAARAIALFEQIHSVDSLALAERLDAIARSGGRAPYPVYLQVNVDDDPAKAGFATADLLELAPNIAALEGLEVLGLMTVGLLAATPEEARPTFRALRLLLERLRSAHARIGPGLSMGMSDDFEVAVEEGATVVRLGRVLFGDRPSPEGPTVP